VKHTGTTLRPATTIPCRVNDPELWFSDHPDDVVKIQAEVTGLDPAILKTVVARSVYGVEPITPQVIADQQALADVFFNIGLIPEKIDIAKAVVSPAAPATT